MYSLCRPGRNWPAQLIMRRHFVSDGNEFNSPHRDIISYDIFDIVLYDKVNANARIMRRRRRIVCDAFAYYLVNQMRFLLRAMINNVIIIV